MSNGQLQRVQGDRDLIIIPARAPSRWIQACP
jgi:hypothetical protein